MSDSSTAAMVQFLASVALMSLLSVGCTVPRDHLELTGKTIATRSPRPRAVHLMRGAKPATLASASPHLVYYGGRVVSNLQVVQVLYGSGSYNAQVAGTGSPSISTFYQGVLNSPYVDWLSEYDTNAQPAPESNQLIGRGAFVSQVTITPSATNDGPTIDDANIQAELAAQIQAGVLPPPSRDAAGNTNTYYAVFFPHGKVITLEGSSSCIFFCAYHGTVANVPGVGEFYYGVHPDFQVGSGCENECGLAPTEFGNVTQVASHEMTETITDPEVGIAPSIAAPLAWYDALFGEIGDICNDEHDTIVGGDGVTYDVQTEFSNLANACIVSRALVPAITTTPLAFEGGTAVTGTVFLGAPAPAGGVSVALASGAPALVGLPASVLISAGSVSAAFPVTSVQTTVQTTVTLTATFPTATASVDLTVLASPTVAGLTVAPSTVTNGASSTGTVTLTGPAPTGGAVVALASSDPTSASVPPTTTIPEGTSTGTFPIATVVRSTTTTVTLSASYHVSTQTAPLTVTGIPAVLEVLLTPTSIEGGSQQEAGGVVPLTSLAPPNGGIIYMAASDPTIVSLLPVEGLAPNADGIGFDLTTTPVLAPTVVTISATYPAGFTQSAPLLVLPPGNAVFDPSLKVPRCASAGRFCDTGGTLVLGRANIANGAEPNTPNTLGAACPDGTSGTFQSNESLDRLSITTLSGDALAAGEMVRVDTSVYAVDDTDSLDVFFAPDATNPVWSLMGTIPSTWFQREMAPSIQFVLPAATLPAIRANWRRGGAPGPCTTGPFDDRDNLVFALASGGPVNHAPTANAGPDQTVNQPASANLSGTASDDGLPSPPGKLTTAWTTVTGPTAAVFADPTALVTTATFWVTGTYTLRLTVSDGALTASDNIVVTVNLPAPVNQPPVVNAGPDQTITLPATATLAGGASDDGLPNPPATLTTTWSVVSGPGTVTFANTANPTTTATFSAAGTYDLRLIGSDSALSASDDIVITVLPAPPVNKPPVVNAGSDQTVTLPAAAGLTGTVTDDGLPNPPAKFTTTWSVVSGPGTVTFAKASNPITTASFSTAGTYDLRLTANDSALSASDNIVITVLPAPVNKAPVVNAGPDRRSPCRYRPACPGPSPTTGSQTHPAR